VPLPAIPESVLAMATGFEMSNHSQQAPPQASALVSGCNLIITELATVRSGVRISSKKVGDLQPGQIVTAFAEQQVDGHIRVLIGDNMWISRITAKGTQLAEICSEPEPEPTTAAKPMTLEEFLAKHRLSHYFEAMAALGAAEVEDLTAFQQSHFDELGMKPLEMKRMRRALNDL
jgi:hypothetical protein